MSYELITPKNILQISYDMDAFFVSENIVGFSMLQQVYPYFNFCRQMILNTFANSNYFRERRGKMFENQFLLSSLRSLVITKLTVVNYYLGQLLLNLF